MAKREKLGRLVLLEETETSSVGREYRAARLGPAGLDRLVSVTCFAPAISSHAAATKRLMEEARLAARLQNPGLVRVLGIGRVEQVFYLSTELVEGRTLASVLERCQGDSFPFAADHALMVASRAAAALEFLQGKKDDAGTTLFHGLLTPSRLIVMYDGEVKLKVPPETT
jgi:serine/threonine protein kinase